MAKNSPASPEIFGDFPCSSLKLVNITFKDVKRKVDQTYLCRFMVSHRKQLSLPVFEVFLDGEMNQADYITFVINLDQTGRHRNNLINIFERFLVYTLVSRRDAKAWGSSGTLRGRTVLETQQSARKAS